MLLPAARTMPHLCRGSASRVPSDDTTPATERAEWLGARCEPIRWPAQPAPGIGA